MCETDTKTERKTGAPKTGVLKTGVLKTGVLAAALRARFGLSEAETQIALALAVGRSPAQIRQSRGVSAHTVRSQLKAIFHKTGARSQAQLVALILRR